MTTMYGGTSANGVPFMSSGDGMGTGALGGGALGLILGMLFSNRNGFNAGVGDAASISTNNAAFEGIRDQINQISQQLNSNQSAAQSAAVQAELSRMRDLFVTLDKDNTIRDCQSTASILAAICECCCKTQAAIADTKFTIATEAAATRLEMANIAAAAALANCETKNLILTEACATRTLTQQLANEQAMRDFQNTVSINATTERSKDEILKAISDTNLKVAQDEINRLNRQLSEQTIINTITQRCGCTNGSSNGNGNGNS